MLKLPGKYPSKKQWARFFKSPGLILIGKEKIVFLVFLALFLASSILVLFGTYFKYTQALPAKGGAYSEGVVGQPRFINPIYAQASDVDRDLVELIFSGLMKYSRQGKIVPDLADSYEIKEDGKVYEVILKENIFWSDGTPLTANDVIFTIKTLQSSEYKSPVIVNWLGVNVEKISDKAVRFTMRNPYAPFLENLTQKIIPEHIWKDISPENFPLTLYNLRPVGSGLYKLKDIKQDKQRKILSLELTKNQKYFGKEPYLSRVSFRFYLQEHDLVKAYLRGEIDGFSLGSQSTLETTKRFNNLNQYSIYLPRYFAVFFNGEESSILANLNVRKALNLATNKDEIVSKVLSGQGKVVNSPALPDIYGFSQPAKTYQFDQESAQALLEVAGFTKNEAGRRVKATTKEAAFQFKSELRAGNQGKEIEELQRCLAKDQNVYPNGEITGYFGEKTKEAVIKFQEKYKKEILEPWGFETGTGVVARTTRDKLNTLCFPNSEQESSLKFSLTTVNQPVLVKVAELLAEQWAKIGVEVDIKTFEVSQLEKEIIKPRNYEALLFGEVMSLTPDPFAFWHSSQVKDPGLNLALYQSREVDRLLETSRQTLDDSLRTEKLEQFQDLVIEAAPAVFLYNPSLTYFVSRDIKGIDVKMVPDPSKRFSEIENWYTKTKRVWK